jgi:hypothetical protein
MLLSVPHTVWIVPEPKKNVSNSSNFEKKETTH